MYAGGLLSIPCPLESSWLEFGSCLLYCLGMRTWVGWTPSLSLSFLICKADVAISPRVGCWRQERKPYGAGPRWYSPMHFVLFLPCISPPLPLAQPRVVWAPPGSGEWPIRALRRGSACHQRAAHGRGDRRIFHFPQSHRPAPTSPGGQLGYRTTEP